MLHRYIQVTQVKTIKGMSLLFMGHVTDIINKLVACAINSGLTEFQIELGVHWAPINELWEPSLRCQEPNFLEGEITI